MGRAPRRNGFRAIYGAGQWHLLVTLLALALAAYTVSVLGLSALWNPDVWWQSIVVWFLGAVIAHDLILFPLYAVADRILPKATGEPGHSVPRHAVPALNYLRIPLLISALTFLLFFPGILEQGAEKYVAATGQTQDPFLHRWLLLCAAAFGLSAIAYAVQLLRARRGTEVPAEVRPPHREADKG